MSSVNMGGVLASECSAGGKAAVQTAADQTVLYSVFIGCQAMQCLVDDENHTSALKQCITEVAAWPT